VCDGGGLRRVEGKGGQRRVGETRTGGGGKIGKVQGNKWGGEKKQSTTRGKKGYIETEGSAET